MSDERGIRDFIARLRDERGATLVLVALGSVAFIGCAAIAIDVGMLMTAKTQGQRVADAAAHSGAVALGQLSSSPQATREAEARERAKETAAHNAILGDPFISLDDADITFPDPHKVRVVVTRNRADGNPIGTIFARILGFDEVDMAVDATAAVFIADGAECALPVALPDRWSESSTSLTDYPSLDDTFDPETDEDDGDPDQYVPWDPDPNDPDVPPNAEYTGYDENSIGDTLRLRTTGGGPGDFNPSWYGPWRHPTEGGSDSGTNDFRNAVTGEICTDGRRVVRRGQDVPTEPGNFGTPTKKAFQDLINQDRTVEWDPNCECVKDGGDVVESTPRIRPVPLFDPRDIPDPGHQPFTITNFMSVFVDRIDPSTGDIIAILYTFGGIESSGVPGVGEGGGGSRVVQIIE